MQQWEYQYVSADQMGRAILINDAGVKSLGFYFSDARRVFGFLRRMGLEGWEIATHVSVRGEYPENHLIFKRPIES